jgi:hypothetical protein
MVHTRVQHKADSAARGEIAREIRRESEAGLGVPSGLAHDLRPGSGTEFREDV